MQKVYFSNQPEKIKYSPRSDGYVDIWLRTNIEEIEETNEEGDTFSSWTADENYFKARRTSMPLKYVEDNFKDLLDLDYSKEEVEITLEQRIEDIENVLAEILGGGLL